MDYANLVAEFGAHYGMGNLAPDENGAVGFEVDGHAMTLQRQDGTGAVVVTLDLVDAPDAGAASVNRLLMQANLALFALDGLALGLQPERNRYQLLGRLDVAAMDFTAFDAAIGRMLARAEQWRTFLDSFLAVAAEADAAAPAAQPPAAGDPFGHLMRV